MSLPSSSSTNPYYCFKDLLRHFLVACLYVPFYSLWLFLTFQWPIRKSPYSSKLKPVSTTSKQVAIVTGANSGIGYEAARALVVEHGMTVIMACRSRDKAMTAAAEINKESKGGGAGGKAVFCHPLDLASFDSVRDFAAAVKEQYKMIHVVVNNAGLAERPGCTVPSENGMDLIFQTNFLGHFLLTSELMSVLAQDARIVNGTSIMYMFCGDYDINDPSFWKDAAKQETLPHKAYGPSKLAALLFTTELNRRYSKRLRSIAVNPGGVNTALERGKKVGPVKKMTKLTPVQGCRTTVEAAVGELHKDTMYLMPYKCPIKGSKYPPFEIRGVYQGPTAKTPILPADEGRRAAAALFEACQELTGATWA